MDLSSLREAGLTDGEVKVYLALLELGPSTTGPIVDRSDVARSFIYHIIDNLVEKGLVSFITRKRTKHFQAAGPQKLLEFIDQRQAGLQENRKKVEKLLPELILKQSLTTQSEANVYTGFKGIRTAHEHTYLKLQKGEEYLFLGIPPFQPQEQHLYWQRDHRRRIKAGIRCRLLFNRDTKPSILKNRNSFAGCEARWMETDIVTPAMFLVYKDTTVIVLQSPSAVAVEIVNQEIADSFKAYFEEYWRKAKRTAPGRGKEWRKRVRNKQPYKK